MSRVRANKRLKFAFNATTNIKGGAVQNAANFIVRAERDSRIDWTFFVSQPVAESALALGGDVGRLQVVKSPARSRHARKAFSFKLNSNAFDLVYTMAGPAYVDVGGLHVMGISNPYITHPTWEAYWCGRGPIGLAAEWMKNRYRMWWAKKADGFMFQTETARDGFHRRLGLMPCGSYVVPNAFGLENLAEEIAPGLSDQFVDRRVVFLPAAGYPHKALHTVPDVLRKLRNYGHWNLVFVLTVDYGSDLWAEMQRKAERFGVSASIVNMGVTPYKSMADLYRVSEIVFVPSLLETFSTSYLEAMGFARPLVVPDRRFAREVCGEGAIYYDGTADGAAFIIDRVLSNGDDSKEAMVEKQYTVLAQYGGQDERYHKIRENLMRFLNVNDRKSWVATQASGSKLG